MSAPVAAVVPVKPLTEALGRLADMLDPPRRRALQAAMLADVLGACMHASRIGTTYVVTADAGAATIAGGAGAVLIADLRPPRGINPAVARGQYRAREGGHERLLILTADLPQVTPEALDGIIDAGESVPVTLVPSRSGTGTNAMVLSPPDALAPEFGEDSLARHVARADAAGVAYQIVEAARLATDVDTPEDLLDVLRAGEMGMEFARACRVLGIDRGLVEACPN